MEISNDLYDNVCFLGNCDILALDSYYQPLGSISPSKTLLYGIVNEEKDTVEFYGEFNELEKNKIPINRDISLGSQIYKKHVVDKDDDKYVIQNLMIITIDHSQIKERDINEIEKTGLIKAKAFMPCVYSPNSKYVDVEFTTREKRREQYISSIRFTMTTTLFKEWERSVSLLRKM